MDKDPSDNFQMPTPMIKLKSSDGEIFRVEVKVAKLSLHFKEMLDDLGVIENEVRGGLDCLSNSVVVRKIFEPTNVM